MKKTISIFSILTILFLTGSAFAEEFYSLDDLTPVQKQKLSQVQFNYKQENDSLENRIMTYEDKLNYLKTQTDKTQEQINLLTSAYQRNIDSLKAQQQLLKNQTDELYQKIMTPNQFKQYQAQQLQVENAFSNFLQK